MTTWNYGFVKYKKSGYEMISVGEIYRDDSGRVVATTDEEFGSMFEMSVSDYLDHKNPEKKAKKEILKDLKRMRSSLKSGEVVVMKQNGTSSELRPSNEYPESSLMEALQQIRDLTNNSVTNNIGNSVLSSHHLCCGKPISEQHNDSCLVGKINLIANKALANYFK